MLKPDESWACTHTLTPPLPPPPAPSMHKAGREQVAPFSPHACPSGHHLPLSWVPRSPLPGPLFPLLTHPPSLLSTQQPEPSFPKPNQIIPLQHAPFEPSGSSQHVQNQIWTLGLGHEAPRRGNPAAVSDLLLQVRHWPLPTAPPALPSHSQARKLRLGGHLAEHGRARIRTSV